MFGEALESARRIDGWREPESVQLVQEMPGRLELAGLVQHRRLPDRRVQQPGGGCGQQHPGRLAGMVADDLPARHLGRVTVDPGRAQPGLVQQHRLVQVGHHHRGIGCRSVQFGDGGQPLFGELVLAPPADHPDPLAVRGAAGLLPSVTCQAMP
jgi:hypothetical protein